MRLDTDSEEIKQINTARQQLGMVPIRVKRRKCLNCNREFKSKGAGNRLCMACYWRKDDCTL